MRGAGIGAAVAVMAAAAPAAADMLLTLRNGTADSVNVSYGQWGELLAPGAEARLEQTTSGSTGFRFRPSTSMTPICQGIALMYYKDNLAHCVLNEWVVFSPRCVLVIDGNGSARCNVTVSLGP